MKIRNTLFLLLFLVASNQLYSQLINTDIGRHYKKEAREGKVYDVTYKNHINKPLSNVQLHFMNSMPTTSEENGTFRVIFMGLFYADPLPYYEISKTGYEVVNDFELRRLTLSNTERLGLDILMAEDGMLQIARNRHYRLGREKLNDKYDKLRKFHLDLFDKKRIDKDQYELEIQNLDQKFEEELKDLDKLSEEFAKLSFIEMTKLQKDALQLFENGEINESNTKLKEANLINQAKFNIEFDRKLRERELPKIDYDDFRERIDYDFEQLDFYKSSNNSTTVLHLYNSLGENYQQMNMSDSAVYYFEKYNQYRETNIDLANVNDIALNNFAESYYKIGTIYQDTLNYEMAIRNHSTFKEFEKKNSLKNPENETTAQNLAKSYRLISDLYILQGEMGNSKENLLEAKQTFTNLLKNSPNDEHLKLYLKEVELRLSEF